VQGKALGMTREAFQTFIESRTHTRRSSPLAELTNAAVFLASDLATGLTGTVANLTGGESAD
jgi:enoyl-[acyl-carrier-protein] reductase (NADH)